MRVTRARLGMLITSLILTAMMMSGQPPEQSPAQSKAKMMTKGKEMMSGDMMGSMMSKHQEMSKLVDQVTADLAVLQGEKDLAIIKKKLAADQTLLEQLKTHMQQQQGMMGSMMERMKMMDNAGKQAPAK